MNMPARKGNSSKLPTVLATTPRGVCGPYIVNYSSGRGHYTN